MCIIGKEEEEQQWPYRRFDLLRFVHCCHMRLPLR